MGCRREHTLNTNKVLAASQRRGECGFATGSDLDPSQPTLLAVINQTLITHAAPQITLGFIHFAQREVNEKLFIYLFIYSFIHLFKMTDSGAVTLGNIKETVSFPHLYLTAIVSSYFSD